MRTDRELLELAARAAGIEVWPGVGFQAHMLFTRPAKADPDGKVTGVEWNPLTDDGDALRLAVALGIVVVPPKYKGFGTTAEPQNGATGCTVFRDDPNEQTRRAIVMAAAEIAAHPKQHNDGGADA